MSLPSVPDHAPVLVPTGDDDDIDSNPMPGLVPGLATLSATTPRFVVAVEGIIGAGKTTLTRALSEELDLVEVPEPVDNNPYLDKFYADQRTWAFPMQMWMVTRRAAAMADVVAQNQRVITDRSLIGDMVFARMHKSNGNISADMWPVYADFWRTAVRLIAPPPDMVLFLDVKPTVALERITERGRKSEVAGIDLTYLRTLSDRYRDVVNNLGNISSMREWFMGTQIEVFKGDVDIKAVAALVRTRMHAKLGLPPPA